jgi:hypothetical protein
MRFLVPPRIGERSPASVEVPWKAEELKANSGRIFRFGSQPGILIRTPAGELRAFTAEGKILVLAQLSRFDSVRGGK